MTLSKANELSDLIQELDPVSERRSNAQNDYLQGVIKLYKDDQSYQQKKIEPKSDLKTSLEKSQNKPLHCI